MATSLFFMATPPEEEEMTHFSSGKIRPEPGKKKTSNINSSSRGRKQKPKGQLKQNRQPQRGMGVAKLESLREQQEMLTKMGDPTRLPVSDPVIGNAIATPAFHGAPAMICCRSCGTAMMGRGSGFLCCGVGPGRVMVDTGRVISRELSSIPKSSSSQQCLYDRCDVCFKKRSHGEGTQSNGGESDKYMTMPQINGWDSPTVNRDIRKSSSGYEKDFTVTAINAHNHSSGHYLNEALDYYMRRSPRNGGAMMLKEYEFFPGKEFQSTNPNETEASGVTPSTHCSPTTSTTATIDLSLKL